MSSAERRRRDEMAWHDLGAWQDELADTLLECTPQERRGACRAAMVAAIRALMQRLPQDPPSSIEDLKERCLDALEPVWDAYVLEEGSLEETMFCRESLAQLRAGLNA